MKPLIATGGVGLFILGIFALNIIMVFVGLGVGIYGIISNKKSKKKQDQEQYAYENLIKKNR
jgi:hypothetical protein